FAVDAGPVPLVLPGPGIVQSPGQGPSPRVRIGSTDYVEQALRCLDPMEWSCLWQSDSLGNGRFRASADYLLWWTRGDRLPPLATTSPPDLNGILGPGTTILFGGDRLAPKERSGARFTGGYRFDSSEESCAFEVGGFFLAPQTVRFGAT